MIARRACAATAIAAAVVGLAGGCSVSPGDKVAVGLREWKIDVAPAAVRAGRVQLEIDNAGELLHDLVLIRKAEVDQLARTPSGGVDVAVDRPIDEIEDLEPGSYLAVSPNVLPGDYLLVCTVTEGADGQPLDHFQAGMWAKLRVMPKSGDAAEPTP